MRSRVSSGGRNQLTPSLGCRGCATRAKAIGAQLILERIGVGTEVELTVTAPRCLREIACSHGFWLFRNRRRIREHHSCPIRILHCGRTPLLREGIAALVNAESDMKLSRKPRTDLKAIKQFKLHHPDVTLMTCRCRA